MEESQREATFKERVFAASWGSMDWRERLKHYFETFEPEEKQAPEEDYEVEEFEPESEADVTEMLNAARRAGIIS